MTRTERDSSTAAVELGIPLVNTVFAASPDKWREVTVHPGRIRRALDALAKNRKLQQKGLG